MKHLLDRVRACRLGDSKGQTMVEFAFVLPVLVMLIFGLIDGGRAIFTYNSLARAAREGARYGAVYGGSQHPDFNWSAAWNGNTMGTYTAGTGHAPSGYSANTIVGRVLSTSPGIVPADLGVQIESWVVVPNTTPFSPGNPLRVTATYVFHPSTPFFTDVPINMSTVAMMNIE